jgi:hypothetical protein
MGWARAETVEAWQMSSLTSVVHAEERGGQ